MSDVKISAFLCVVVALCGCGGNSNDLTEVTGRVMIDGKPLTVGSIVTMPERGPGARGTIDSSGEFTLSTTDLGSGASIGIHHVAVVAVEDGANLSPEAPRKSLIPQKYASPETSGLTIEVTPGEMDEVVLELSSAE